MSDDLTQELKFTADATGIEAGVERGKRSIKSLGKAAEDVGKEGGDSLGKVGAGAQKSSKDIDQATRNMEASLQRQIAKFETAGQSARQYQESLARMRGADLAKLKPLLDQLDAAKEKSEAAARAQRELGKAAAAADNDQSNLAGRFTAVGTAAGFAKTQILAMAAGLSFGGMVAWVQQINDGVDALNDIKDATGASIENISALEDVGRRTGASFETVGSILVKFNDVLSKATPKSDIALALKAIGLEADNLKKMDPAEALRVTAVALSGYADNADKARLIQDLFGKSVKEAAPFLTDLAEQTKLVATRTTEQAEAAEKFNKRIFDLKTTSNDLSRDLVDKMLPGLTQIVGEMGRGAKEGGALLAVWRGLREFGKIAFGTDALGQVQSRANEASAEIKRLSNMMIAPLAVLERDPERKTADGQMAGRRVDVLRTKIEGLMKTAADASQAIRNLVEPPKADTPKGPDKPEVVTGPSAAERAAAAAAAKKAADESKKEVDELNKTFAELNNLSSSYYADLAKLQSQYAKGDLSQQQYVAGVEKLIQKQPFAIDLTKKEADALKLLTKERQDAADAKNKDYEAADKFLEQQQELAHQTVKGIEDRIAAMEQEEDAARLAAATNISLAEAINRVRIARLQEKRDGPTGVNQGSEEYDRATAEIEALRKEADRINYNDRSERVRDINRRAQEETKRYIEDTQRGLGDAIETAIFDGSKKGGQKMREVLQEALLRKPLRMVIDGVLNQVTGGALQLLGLGGGGAAGGAGGGGGLGNVASLASSAYDFSQGTGALYNAYGAVSAYAGLTNTAAATYLSHPLAGIATQGAIPGFGAGGGAATTAGGMGSMAMGGIVTAIMLAFINAFGGMRTETMIGSGLAGTLGGKSALTPWQEWREGGTLFDGPSFATHNPLEELDIRRAELQRMRDSGNGETNYAVAIQAVVTDLEKTTKGLAEQTEIFNREIGKGYKAYRDNVVDMADSLGLAGSSIKDFAYTLGAQDLNFQGLKPEEIQAKIEETFGKAGTEMAQQLLGSFREVTDTVVNTYVTEQRTQNNEGAFQTDTTVTKRMEYQASVYAKTGETAIQTLTRLATSFGTLNNTADALGFGIQKGSLALGKFADDFIAAFGGLERFTASTGAFLQNYYSDEERRQALLRSGARQAESLGIKGVTAESLEQLGKDGIRAFVNSLSASPEAYADAIDLANFLAPAFTSIETQAPVVEQLANVVDELTQSYQNAVKSLTGDRDNLAVERLRAEGDEPGAKALEKTQYMAQFAGLDEVRRREIETLYDANVATRAYIEGIKLAAQARVDALAAQRDDARQSIADAVANTDAAWAAIEATFAKQRQELETTKATLQQFVDTAKAGAKSMFSQVDDVARFQGIEARAFIEEALAAARSGGKVPDGEDLADALAAVEREFSAFTGQGKAETDYQRLVVANQLKGLQDVGEDQLSETEQQLKKLDEDLEQGRTMINELRGINSGAKDMATAIQNLVTAFNKEQETRNNTAAKGILSSRGGYFDYASGTGLTSAGTFFDADAIKQAAIDSGATGPQMFAAIKAAGFTIAEAEKMFGSAAGSLEEEARKYGVPIFHEGTDYVPRTGWALLQEGEAVIPARHNPFPTGTLGGSGRLEALIAQQTARMDAVVASVDKVAASALLTAQILNSVKRGSALAIAEPTKFLPGE